MRTIKVLTYDEHTKNILKSLEKWGVIFKDTEKTVTTHTNEPCYFCANIKPEGKNILKINTGITFLLIKNPKIHVLISYKPGQNRTISILNLEELPIFINEGCTIEVINPRSE
ncbi:hypothetical protein [Serratia marcescens]|uniref:hypothetical protein n=1 Tax=Serratia marcescens TaxID=615 RepID=UPI00124A693E|nr:hypothetical protein [Serratia marcescens]KAB1578747.1 hypothetical protein F7687_22710 [Serratia marcescens]